MPRFKGLPDTMSSFIHSSNSMMRIPREPSRISLHSPVPSVPFLCTHLTQNLPLNLVELDIVKTLPTSLRRTPDSDPVSPFRNPQPSIIKSRSNLPAWTPPCLPRPHSPTPKQTVRYAKKKGVDQVVYTKPQTTDTSTETGSSIQLQSAPIQLGSSCNRCTGHKCTQPFGSWSEYQKGIWVQNGAVDSFRWGPSPRRTCGQPCEWAHLSQTRVNHSLSKSHHCSHTLMISESGKSSRADSPTISSLHAQHHKCRRPH